MAKHYVVNAEWDPKAGVYWASSEDVPGLAIEAESVEALVERLRVVVPELMAANGLAADGDIAVSVRTRRLETMRLSA